VFGEQSQFGTIATSASVLLLKPLVYVKPFSVARGGQTGQALRQTRPVM